ncbi:MAG: DMT family transporter [Bacteroidales bacterium]|nr:DMT family transporter [Bacteroidales bacterium]
MARFKSISPVILGAVCISISAVLWGLDGVLFTPQLSNLDVGFVVFVLHLLPFLLMQPFFYQNYKKLKTYSTKEILALFAVALFGGALGTICIVKALFLVDFNHLSEVVLLQKLQPIFAIILAAIVLKEKIKPDFLIWASIAIIAGYFLTFGWAKPDFSESSHLIAAVIFTLLAAFSFGSSTVFSKYALRNIDFTTATFFRYGFTTIIMLVYMLITWKWSQFSATTSHNWIFFIIIALTTGSGAIFLYYYGLRNVKAIISTICELFFPISAIIFDYLLHDARLSLVQWLAAFVMIFCVIMLNINNKKEKSTTTSPITPSKNQNS